MEGACTLRDLISAGSQGLFIETWIDDEIHVGVHRKCVGAGWVPTKFATECLCGCEGVGARIAEVAPWVLIEFARDGEGLEMFRDDGAGVICGPSVLNADCVGKGEGGLNTSCYDAGFILNHKKNHYAYTRWLWLWLLLC